MLLALKISNIAVIEEAELHLGPGLTVLTGETGAGKSVLIDALSLTVGERADGELIRAGCEEASVEAIVQKTGLLETRLAELGLPDLGDEISLRRTLLRNSRGKVHINGALVTVGVLGRLMRGTIDVSGQQGYVSLFDPAFHRVVLDRVGKLTELCDQYRESFSALKAIDRRIAELGGSDAHVQQRAEFLQFQLDEIARIDPKPSEEAKLEDERGKLAGIEKLRKTLGQAEELLCGDEGSVLELLGRAQTLFDEAVHIDPSLDTLAISLKESAADLEQGARGLSRYTHALESDPRRLAEVDERLDSIRRLCRKHGCPLDGLLARRQDIANELHQLHHRRTLLDCLNEERRSAEAVARAKAVELSARRHRVAEQLSVDLKGGLAELAMPKAQLQISVRPEAELGQHGIDEVEFFFSANEGEPLRPLSRVASGGEGSRVLLALKRVLAGEDDCSCYVLDESDAGVGGSVAESVGRMVREIGSHRQVLFITHLPQVAAFGDSHMVIEKRHREGRTISRVVRLETPEARQRELARMLSGIHVTDAAKTAAEALMRSASRRLAVPTHRCTRPEAVR